MSAIAKLVIPVDLDKTQPSNPHVRELVSQLREVREHGGKVYSTTVVDEAQGVAVFLTTSKDMHLGFGELGRAGQFILAKTIEYEFRQGIAAKTGQLMLGIQKEKRNRNEEGTFFALVTAIPQNDVMTYTFSPAR